MINEKGLVREMKWAYKIMGYTVVDHGAEMSIYTNDWYIHCDKWKIPRKVLATLAEHMGQLTDEGGRPPHPKRRRPPACHAHPGG